MTLEQDIWKASKGLGLNATIEVTEALRLIHEFKLDLAKRLGDAIEEDDVFTNEYVEVDETGTQIAAIIEELKLDLADKLDKDYGSQMDSVAIIEELKK